MYEEIYFWHKRVEKFDKKSRRGGGTTCVATPEELGVVCNVLVEVTCGGEATFPLGFGNFYEALDIVTPEGLGEVYNTLVEVTCGVGQRFWPVLSFCHAEFISASHDVDVILNTSLRGAKRRGNPLIYRLNNFKSPLSLTLSLGEGTILYPLAGGATQPLFPLLWGRAEFSTSLRVVRIRERVKR